MTSPPPGGALHATGKRVVRELAADDIDAADKAPPGTRFGRHITIAAGVGSAMILAAVLAVLLRHHHDPSSTDADPQKVASALETPNPAPSSNSDPTSTPAQAATSAPDAPKVEVVDDRRSEPSPRATATSFGNGRVTHSVVLQVKLDGPITAIHGTRIATGFAVVVPGRKTLDSGSSLSRLDTRIATVRVANRTRSTEVTFEFRDEVPAYLVRAHGDHLEIALARSGGSAHGPTATRTNGPASRPQRSK
jgi:hypothetical protein